MKCAKCREEIKKVKFIQIIAGNYDNTYSLIALGDDGVVYKYRHQYKAWEAMTTEVLG